MTWSSKDFFDKYERPSGGREIAIVKEVLSGNVPSWMFDLYDVKIGDDVIEVMPDYLAIGTDQDYVRCPMTPFAAQAIANYYTMTLPTPALVDAIWKQASLQIAPYTPNWNYVEPITGDQGFRFVEHSKEIDQMIGFEDPMGSRLIAGQKKDIVSDMYLLKHNAHRVVIYGWHQLNGIPIQPETKIHSWAYSDYSHGVRLVKDPSGKWSGPCSLDQAPTEFANAFKAV